MEPEPKPEMEPTKKRLSTTPPILSLDYSVDCAKITTVLVDRFQHRRRIYIEEMAKVVATEQILFNAWLHQDQGWEFAHRFQLVFCEKISN